MSTFAPNSKICSYYAAGHCKYGLACRFYHPPSAGQVHRAQVDAQQRLSHQQKQLDAQQRKLEKQQAQIKKQKAAIAFAQQKQTHQKKQHQQQQQSPTPLVVLPAVTTPPGGALVVAPSCGFAKKKKKHQNQQALTVAHGPPKKNVVELVSASGNGAARVVVEERSVAKKSSVPRVIAKKYVVFGVDTSSSMKGERTELALTGLHSIIERNLGESDVVTMTHFDTSVNELFSRVPVRKLSWKKAEADLRTAAAMGGMTSVFDAIATAIVGLPRGKGLPERQAKFVVVLTDGGDNSSKTTHEQCCELVKKPGVPHLYFVVVGIALPDGVADKMRALCAPPHAHFVQAGSSADEFERAFRVASETMITFEREFVLRVRQKGDADVIGMVKGAIGKNAGALIGSSAAPVRVRA